MSDHRLKGANALHNVCSMRYVMCEIRAVEHPGERTDQTAILFRHVPGVLERLPRDLEEDPLLRVHHFSFTCIDPKKLGIEHLHIAQHATRSDVLWVRAQVAGNCLVQLRVRPMRDGVASCTDVPPHFLDTVGSWKASCHANHGNVPVG